MNKKHFLAFLLLSLLLIILRLPSLDVPLDVDSGANAFFARQIIRGENLYDKFHPAHHLPGIYYTFVVSFKLFGDNEISPRIWLFPYLIVSIWLMLAMGRQLHNESTGRLAALFFVLGISQAYIDGMTIQMEHFANLFLISCTYFLIEILIKSRKPVHFIWVGMLGSFCIIYKVMFVAPLIMAGLSIFLLFLLEKGDHNSFKEMTLRLFWLSVGVILPLALVGGYYAVQGLWLRFILVFTFGLDYFGDRATMGKLVFSKPFGFPLFMLAWNNIVLLILGLLGSYTLIRRSIPLRSRQDIANITISLWWICSAALAGSRGGGYPHYILTIIPPLALVAGFEISFIYEKWKTVSIRQARLITTIITSLVIGVFIVANYNLYHPYILYKSGWISYGQFADQISSFSFKDMRPVSTYINQHTTSKDFIYLWGVNNIQTYYFADREPPIDILWPSYISATGPPERIFDENTKYIILDSPDKLPQPGWLTSGLNQYYKLEIIIMNEEIYRQIKP